MIKSKTPKHLKQIADKLLKLTTGVGSIQEVQDHITKLHYAALEQESLLKIATTAQELLDALARADKQWLGLNMLNPGQKRAYEIELDGKIKLEKALAELTRLQAKTR